MTENEQIVLNTARSQGMPAYLSNLILAQAKHESNNFTSAVYQDCNNAFGYSAPGGVNYCKGHSFYRAYNNLQESVIELTNWIKRRQKENKFPQDLNTITSPDQYAQLLKSSGYYEDSTINYTNGLKRWFVNNILPVSTSLIFIALVVGVLILNQGNKHLLR